MCRERGEGDARGEGQVRLARRCGGRAAGSRAVGAVRGALVAGVVTALGAGTAVAAERLAVLEFFGRPGGAYCRAAAPAMLSLQQQLAGSAVLLEYDFDQFSSGRVDRFVAAEPLAYYLPLVMVGSGYRTSWGPVDYLAAYSAMLSEELERAPQAEVRAYWRRVGDAVRCYARVTNLADVALTPAESAAVWLIVWENDRIGLTDTWVRASAPVALPVSLAPGATTDLVIDTGAIGGADWAQISCLALVERRPGGSGRYDALQAAVAGEAGLAVTPGVLSLGRDRPRGEVALEGPAVLSWTASCGADWVTVSPAGGAAPATVSIAVDPAKAPAAGSSATVRFDASGDGVSDTATVQVSWRGRLRPPRRLVRTTPSGRAPD
jgi:thiol-disulfide isomerase/thioredoxin